MQRDFNLIRSILFSVEANLAGSRIDSSELVCDKYDPATITEHIEILIEHGFLHAGASFANPETGQKIYVIDRLTWQGHEFLDNARNDTIWKKVMAQAQEKGTSVSMTVLNGLLTKAAQNYFGLV
ncbi:DUF2513 domain-containing protein [Leptolyngbya sp. 7M]|uniref:DUF2513 domain-containing protein n=1 Tax=Leptolyngbya sp. 7M TaxID=2812896 RepID=UPI001B8C7630|nr:DUF2513 domain-containing protein [Leptolyngbya sp. 7M]QYO62302.1 DUF2513 domain-containing protein [Leptolyngbya sp. 7M]